MMNHLALISHQSLPQLKSPGVLKISVLTEEIVRRREKLDGMLKTDPKGLVATLF